MTEAEANPFAALFAELEERLQLDGQQRFLTFPAFPIAMKPEDLIFDGAILRQRLELEDAGAAAKEAVQNEENFARILNQIPPGEGAFIIDGRMVWSVYQKLLRSAELPLAATDEEQLLDATEAFAEARSNFELLSKVSAGDGSTFLPVSLTPAGQDVTWSKLGLDDEEFSRLAPQASARVQRLLELNGLLENPLAPDFSISSLTLEVAPVQLRRPWLQSEVIESRAWRWNEDPLSDGGDPPQGLLPAVVSGIVLGRNLVLGLDAETAGEEAAPSADEPATDTATPAIFSAIRAPRIAAFRATTAAAPGPDKPAPKPPALFSAIIANPKATLKASFKPGVERLRRATSVPTVSLQQAAQMTIKPPEVEDDEEGPPTIMMHKVAGDEVFVFPVPPTFDVAALIQEFTDLLAAAQREKQQAQAQQQQEADRSRQLGRQIAAIEQDLERLRRAKKDRLDIQVRDHRGGVTVTRTRVIVRSVLEGQLKPLEQQRDASRKARERAANRVQAADEQIEASQEALALLRSLAPAGADDDAIFLLALICQRLPKAPNPDPDLFAA